MYFRMRHEGEDYFLCPVTALSNLENALSDLIGYEKDRGREKLNFVCLPENFADKLARLYPQAEVSSNRGSADYLYEKEKLAAFSGKALHAKKNHKNRFMALYGDSYEYRVMTPDDVPLCKAFNEKWYAANSAYTDFEFSNEHIATTKMLEHFELLGLTGGLIFVNGELLIRLRRITTTGRTRWMSTRKRAITTLPAYTRLSARSFCCTAAKGMLLSTGRTMWEWKACAERRCLIIRLTLPENTA